MKFLRQLFTGRLLCFFMALHVLNISIDTPTANGIAEDLTYNKQESIVELLLEKVFLDDNIIGEYDECDHEDAFGKKISAGPDFYLPPALSVFTPSFSGDINKDTFHNIPAFADVHTEIHSPPPEV